MEYFKVGKIVTTHGVNVNMFLRHSLRKKTGWKSTEVIFIEEREGSFLPWFIQSATVLDSDKVLLSIEGVSTRESAHKFLKKEVWLNQKDFPRLASTASPVSLLGFEVVEGSRNLGTVSEVIEQPHQTLCKIIINEKEVLIPIHEATLLKIDRSSKRIYVKLPEGLLDVYLS